MRCYHRRQLATVTVMVMVLAMKARAFRAATKSRGMHLSRVDCDDNDPVRNPDLEQQDLDGDGFGGETSALSCEDLPATP